MTQAFRVMIDLSKFFDDARSFSMIFIDQNYLPMYEDTRILKENEMLTAMPGSERWNNNEAHMTQLTLPMIQGASIEDTGIDESNLDKETQTIHDRINKSTECSFDTYEATISDIHTANATSADMIATDVTLYHSILNDTEMNASMSKSKITDSNVTEDFSVIEDTLKEMKRKRIRRRRSKKQTPSTPSMHDVSMEESDPKKPRIINSCVIPRGTHIHFDGTDNQHTPPLVHGKPNEAVTPKVPQVEPHQNTFSLANDLSTLLALRQSSTPLTFTSGKAKQKVKTESLSDNLEKNDNSVKEKNGTRITLRDTTQNTCYSLLANFEQYPAMTGMAQNDNIIAFKVLKMGNDYSPQISDFVVAKVIERHPDTLQYTLKMIKGKDEIQVPTGKFALPQEETELVETDVINLNHSQLIEPRLIFSK